MSIRMKTFVVDGEPVMKNGKAVKVLRTAAGWRTREQAPTAWAKYDDQRRRHNSKRHPDKSLRRGYAGAGRIPRDQWRKV